MPDGWDAHKELARIYTLRELMQSCRGLVPEIIDELSKLIHDADPMVRLRAMDMAMDRGFGKARQHHVISDMGERGQGRIQLYIPDNGRAVKNGPVIDAEAT